LRPGAEGAPRVKAPPILHLVPGREMPAGPPFAQRVIARVGGDEAGGLVRRALGKVLGKRPRIDAPVELLLAKRHNPHCSYHIVYRFHWEVKRSSLPLHRVEGLSHKNYAVVRSPVEPRAHAPTKNGAVDVKRHSKRLDHDLRLDGRVFSASNLKRVAASPHTCCRYASTAWTPWAWSW
jgi:hypothetical protein